MARVSRKLIGVVILLIILLNIRFLTQKHFPKTFDVISSKVDTSESNGAKPEFKGSKDPWLQDTKESLYDTSNANGNSHGSSNAESRTGNEQHKGSPPKDQHAPPSKDPQGHKEGSAAAKSTYSNTQAPNFDTGMAQIKKVLDAIVEIKPGVPPLKKYNRQIQADSSLEESGELPPTSEILGMYLQISDEEVETLKRSHRQMMGQLPSSVPRDAFTGRGIVMTGGGKYFPMVLTAIRWLREEDKTTPIEVFMADKSEYEPQICDGLFPKLKVECRVIQDIYGKQLAEKLSSKYALKPLAILASKFDDIYFMDADSYPLSKLDRVFEWDVYKDTGLILNADYWPRYISPKFYEIAGITLGGRARGDPNSGVLLQSDRENAVPGRSTESGQIFVRKSTHIKSLLLAMYYNYFGEGHYFSLLMQNGSGEGDKDTYAAAAIICGEKYYQTQRRPVTLGQHLEEGGFKGFAMSQPDPIIDYERFERKRDDLKEDFFALHANSIKSNPKYLLQSYEEPIRGAPPMRQHRFFGDMNNVRRELLKDNDVEQRLFRTMKEVTCEWAVQDGYVPRDWEDVDMKHMCTILDKHTTWLREHPDVAAPSTAPFWIDLEGKVTKK